MTCHLQFARASHHPRSGPCARMRAGDRRRLGGEATSVKSYSLASCFCIQICRLLIHFANYLQGALTC